MEHDNNRPPEPEVVPDLLLTVKFNPGTGELLVSMPPQANPLMLYGMCEYAKDEVRRRFIAPAQRDERRILTPFGPGIVPQ